MLAEIFYGGLHSVFILQSIQHFSSHYSDCDGLIDSVYVSVKLFLLCGLIICAYPNLSRILLSCHLLYVVVFCVRDVSVSMHAYFSC